MSPWLIMRPRTMKTVIQMSKRIIFIILAALMIFAMMPAVAANETQAASDEVACVAGETVTVQLEFENISGIQMVLFFSNPDVIARTQNEDGKKVFDVQVDVQGLSSYMYFDTTLTLLAYQMKPVSKVVITITFKIADDAEYGDVGKLIMEYETTQTGDDLDHSIRSKTLLIQGAEYKLLDQAITDAERKINGDFTVNSLNYLQQMLALAKTAREQAKTQKEITDATAQLNEALAALVDVSSLKEVIASVADLVASDYSTKTWDQLQAIIAQSSSLLTDGSNEQVAQACDNILAAKGQLIDVTSLISAINDAETYLKDDSYTEQSQNALAIAVEAAKSLLESATSNDQVEAAIQDLHTRIAALNFKPGENPDDDSDKDTQQPRIALLWVIVALNGVIILAAVAGVVYFIIKRKKEKDSTPLIDYSIDDEF